jgi:hypothetical protein
MDVNWDDYIFDDDPIPEFASDREEEERKNLEHRDKTRKFSRTQEIALAEEFAIKCISDVSVRKSGI